MARKLGGLAIIWIGIVVSYITMSAMFPAIQTIISGVSANISSYSASAYPGAKAGIDVMPLVFWFIPGLVGVLVSVVWLKSK